MTLQHQIETKLSHPLFFRSARKTNAFIESIIMEASQKYTTAWEAEKFIDEKIKKWNEDKNHFKLHSGSGASHVYIHLSKKNSKENRLAIIREVL